MQERCSGNAFPPVLPFSLASGEGRSDRRARADRGSTGGKLRTWADILVGGKPSVTTPSTAKYASEQGKLFSCPTYCAKRRAKLSDVRVRDAFVA